MYPVNGPATPFTQPDMDGGGASEVAHFGRCDGQIPESVPSVMGVVGAPLRCVVMTAIDTVWHRIVAYSGEAFQPEHGKSFTYSVSGDTVHLDTTDQDLSRLQIAVALTRMPLSHPVQLSDLAGPRYIYAILTDPRITGDDVTYRNPAIFA